MTTCKHPDCQVDADKEHYEGTWCNAKQPDGHYVCSRQAGHTGEHTACNTDVHDLVSWGGIPESSSQLDLQTLVENLDALLARLNDDIRPCVDEAASRAEDAESCAYSAKDSAADAESCAEDAKTQAQYAMEHLDELQSEIQALQAQIKDALGTGGARNLQADIRKWKPRVSPQLANGASHSRIATTLGISEFLVQCIEDELKKEKAERAA